MAETVLAEKAEASDDIYAGIKVIDVDTHFTEPADFWTSRAPARYKDRVPKVHLEGDTVVWSIDGMSLGPASAAAVVHPDRSKSRGMEWMKLQAHQVHPACSEVGPRLALMDEHGIHAQIVYPNILGFGGQRGAQLDADVRLVSTQIYNDAMAEMQAESGNRLLPMPLLPWWDIKLAVAEAERCLAMGMKGVNINSDPQDQGMQDLSGDYWTPLWEFCSAHDLPVNFHIGASDTSASWWGSSPWPSVEQKGKLAIGSTMLFIGNARVLINLIVSGLLERFPRLKVVSVESGIGWMPFILEAIEYSMIESGSKTLPLTAKEYFRRQVYGCFWFENEDLVHTARQVGIDNVMFETDFPHPTCVYPDPLDHVRPMMAKFTPEERKKVMSLNAARVYNLDLD